jgi:excisionase family DNA binding protein
METTLITKPEPAHPMRTEDQPGWSLPLIEYLKEAADAGMTVTVTSNMPTLTPRQAADFLHISRATVSRRITSGEIKTIKVGNRHRIPVPEFERFRSSLMQAIVDHYADDIETDLIDRSWAGCGGNFSTPSWLTPML